MKENVELISITEMMNEQSIPLRDAVFLSLRRAILTGKLEPGERLTEVRLGKLLGTSRTPIREAIRKLELEGLVTIVPGSGARVAKMTAKDLQEVMEVRSALDQLSARLASRRITSEEKAQLREANRLFGEAIRSGSQLDIAEADVKFHDVIIQAARNQKLHDLISGLADNIYRYRFEFIKDDVHYEQLEKEHTEIMTAIIEGDEERAVRASGLHINRQWRFIHEQLPPES